MRSTHKLSLFVLLVLVATAACSSQEQGRVQTAVVGAGETAAADIQGSAETRVAQARDTALAAVNDQRNRVGTEIAQQIAPSPWDTRWLPPDHRYAAARVDGILAPTGMAGQGTLIAETGVKMGVNPAVALSTFRKEASFAAPNTSARTNNNPGNNHRDR